MSQEPGDLWFGSMTKLENSHVLWLLLLLKPFHGERIICVFFTQGTLVIFLLNNLHTLTITESLLFPVDLQHFFLLLSTFHPDATVIISMSYLLILRLYVEHKDPYLTSLGSAALHISAYQIPTHTHTLFFLSTPTTRNVLRRSTQKEKASGKGKV